MKLFIKMEIVTQKQQTTKWILTVKYLTKKSQNFVTLEFSLALEIKQTSNLEQRNTECANAFIFLLWRSDVENKCGAGHSCCLCPSTAAP